MEWGAFCVDPNGHEWHCPGAPPTTDQDQLAIIDRPAVVIDPAEPDARFLPYNH